MYKVRILLMLVCALALTSIAQAQEIIRIGDSVSGELPAGTAVEYQFEGKAGETLLINLTGEFDTVLTVIDGDGFDLVSDDDGGEGSNSRIRGFAIPADGVYTIRVDSYNDDDSGAFTLSIEAFNPETIELGETVTFEATVEQYFALPDVQGKIVDIVVNSENTIDTRLEIISPFGYVVSGADDSTGSVDPVLNQTVLSDDGTYFIAVFLANPDTVVSGEIELTVTEAELVSLDDGPVDLVFGANNVNRQALVFDGVEGETVRLTISIESDNDWASPFIRIQQEGTEFVTFSQYGTTGTVADFEVPADGEVMILVEAYSDMTINVVLGRGM